MEDSSLEKIKHKGDNSKERMMLIKEYMNRSLEEVPDNNTNLPPINNNKPQEEIGYDAQRDFLNKLRNT